MTSNCPVPLVLTTRVMEVFFWVTVTLAFGTTAPVESVTVPEIGDVATTLCERSGYEPNERQNEHKRQEPAGAPALMSREKIHDDLLKTCMQWGG